MRHAVLTDAWFDDVRQNGVARLGCGVTALTQTQAGRCIFCVEHCTFLVRLDSSDIKITDIQVLGLGTWNYNDLRRISFCKDNKYMSKNGVSIAVNREIIA